MKHLTSAFIIMLFTLPAYADHSSALIDIQLNQAVVEVKGIVCSFCAHGANKALSKLTFLDKSQLKKGVLVDIKNQRIWLALDASKPIGFKTIYESVKNGGYEPVAVHFQVRGKLEKLGKHFYITNAKNQQRFEVTGTGLDNLAKQQAVMIHTHVDAYHIPGLKAEAVIKVMAHHVVLQKGDSA